MGNSKRKFADFSADASSGNGESQGKERVPGLHAPKRRKNKHGKKTKARPNNLNWVKKRAKVIERRLKTGQNIPANMGNEMERELEHHKLKIAEAEDVKKRKMMMKKYQMIRFFERKKADRLAKQIQTQIDECQDAEEKKKLEHDLHVAQIDSLYAKFFPYRERYVSLYPVNMVGLSVHGGEKPETASSAARALQSERPPLWGQVEKMAKKGVDILMEFRERKLATDSRSKAPKERPSKHSFAAKAGALKAKSSFASDGAAKPAASANGKTLPKAKAAPESSSDSSSSESDSDDSDGGFFEKA